MKKGQNQRPTQGANNPSILRTAYWFDSIEKAIWQQLILLLGCWVHCWGVIDVGWCGTEGGGWLVRVEGDQARPDRSVWSTSTLHVCSRSLQKLNEANKLQPNYLGTPRKYLEYDTLVQRNFKFVCLNTLMSEPRVRSTNKILIVPKIVLVQL